MKRKNTTDIEEMAQTISHMETLYGILDGINCEGVTYDVDGMYGPLCIRVWIRPDGYDILGKVNTNPVLLPGVCRELRRKIGEAMGFRDGDYISLYENRKGRWVRQVGRDGESKWQRWLRNWEPPGGGQKIYELIMSIESVAVPSSCKLVEVTKEVTRYEMVCGSEALRS